MFVLMSNVLVWYWYPPYGRLCPVAIDWNICLLDWGLEYERRTQWSVTANYWQMMFWKEIRPRELFSVFVPFISQLLMVLHGHWSPLGTVLLVTQIWLPVSACFIISSPIIGKTSDNWKRRKSQLKWSVTVFYVFGNTHKRRLNQATLTLMHISRSVFGGGVCLVNACVCCVSALMAMFNMVGLCCRPAASYISPV